ncbi:EspF repeat-containing protein [Kitasatospora griseola]
MPIRRGGFFHARDRPAPSTPNAPAPTPPLINCQGRPLP